MERGELRGMARVTERARGCSVLFARDGRVAIATGGCLLLRPAVVWGGTAERRGVVYATKGRAGAKGGKKG